MATSKQLILDALKEQLKDFAPSVGAESVGTVTEIGDGIASIAGLDDVQSSDIIEFPKETFCFTLNLEASSVGAFILGAYEHIK